MASRYTYVVLLVLALVLSACFRQASKTEDTLDSPIANTALPNNGGGNVIVPASDTPVSGGVPTQIPMITSTPAVPVNTIQPTDTILPTIAPVTTDDGGISNPQPMYSPSPSPMYLTPDPLGSSAVDTPLPNTALPTLQPTPTDIEDVAVSDDCIYVVQAGDNLFRIAITNGATQAEMQEINNISNPDLIQPGDELIIPNCEGGVIQDVADDTTPDATAEGDSEIITPITHVVQAGETLGSIANYYGVTNLSIIQANSLANPDALSIGQELIIPPIEQ